MDTLVKGMRQVQGKNVVVDLQSKTRTWEDLKVRGDLIEGLKALQMDRPSVIQAFSIPKIMD